MTAFLWAVRAIQETDVDLAGNIHVTGTVGEIYGTRIDEYQDSSVIGSGIGTEQLINSGIIGDYAIVADD